MRNAFSILVLFSLLVMAVAAHAGGIQIIVNSSVPDLAIDKATIGNIYHGKKTSWSNGAKIVPIMLKSGAVHEDFVANILGKTTSQFNNFWTQAMFTGQGIPPQTVNSDAEVVQFVNNTPGAIGYVAAGTDIGSAKKVTVQ